MRMVQILAILAAFSFYSAFIATVLSSDFIMVPVRRSPFVNTIWSANDAEQNEKAAKIARICTIRIASSNDTFSFCCWVYLQPIKN